jgi:hypothetical protein
MCTICVAFIEMATHCTIDTILRFFPSSKVKCHCLWFTTHEVKLMTENNKMSKVIIH